jgi:hypothetical protein
MVAGMIVVAIPNREFPPADDALSLTDVRVDSIAELTREVVRDAARRSRSRANR